MYKNEDIYWYHGKLTREGAEKLLKQDERPEGSFLVRESNSSTGDYVLSVLHNKDVSHFQIRRHSEDAFFSIDENTKIHGLESLIEHYQIYSGLLSEDLTLTVPVKGEAPPHDSRRHGRTNLLHRATKQESYTVVSELLKAGYQLEAKNQDGQTAVHIASMSGKDDILTKLIRYGASVNSRDTAGYTPLHYACQNNFPTTVRLLIQLGSANIQARNTETGAVPLHEAASHGHKEVIKELLSLNAPVKPRDNNNNIPAKIARLNGYIDCAEILENYKSPIPRTNKSKWYHGTLGRDEAEIIVRNHSTTDGTFLVRFSDRKSIYVLTLLYENILYNFPITKEYGHFSIDNGPYLESLEHVIDYYSFIPDGLPICLQIPVPPKPKPPVPDFSTIPRPNKKPSKPNTEKLTKNDTLSTKLSCPSQFQNITFTTNFVNTVNNNNNNNNISNNNYNYLINDNTDDNIDIDDNDNDHIPLERLKLGRVIGEGEFGSVYEGTYTKKNGDIINVAIKTLRNEQIELNKESFLSEAQVMMNLNHYCIIKFIGLSIGPSLLMVQELVPFGSMLQYLLVQRESVNPNHDFKIWPSQIACGMKYLEEQRFIHRDLAARNILLATRNQVKISDFGLSRALGTGNQYYRATRGGKWPIKWYAPESFNYGTFSHKSDVWGFGVTIWEMYSFGAAPYGDAKGADAIKFIESGERLQQPEACPDNIYQIMRNCWEYKAEKRPTFNELYNFFSSDSVDYMNV